MYIADCWREVARGSFPEMEATELNHEGKTGVVRSTKVGK